MLICQVAQRERGTKVFYVPDHLGGTARRVGEEGDQRSNMEYLPFGERIQGEGDRVTYGFTGKEEDEESGLSYFGARYYDASIGRWMSKDPEFVNFPGRPGPNFNLYAYGGNNPIKFIDRDGQKVLLGRDAQQAEAIREDIAKGLPPEMRGFVGKTRKGREFVLNLAPLPEGTRDQVDPENLELYHALWAVIERSHVLRVHAVSYKERFPVRLKDGQRATTTLEEQEASGVIIPERRMALHADRRSDEFSMDSETHVYYVKTQVDAGGSGSDAQVEDTGTVWHELVGHGLPLLRGRPYYHPTVDKRLYLIETWAMLNASE
jgi:RHS repeat-associated protein